MDYTAAGILPVTIHQGHIYLLLGLENSGWSGFGGRRNPGEGPADTAIRECMEESMGLIFDLDELKNIFRGDADRLIFGYRLDISTYIEYAIRIEYTTCIVKYFNRARRQFDKCNRLLGACSEGQCNITGVDIGSTCSAMFEKKEIAWWRIEDVMVNLDKMRPAFAKVFTSLEFIRTLYASLQR